MNAPKSDLVVVLNWSSSDFEQRLGFTGGKYTDANAYLALLIGCVSAAVLFGLAYLIPDTHFSALLLQRGVTPFFIVPFSTWAISILLIKSRKLAFQRRALDLMVVPREHDFILSPATATQVLDRMYGLVDSPRHFVLLSRIERSLANLNNIGEISDVSEILRSQAENDEDYMESSYVIVKVLIWGIPVLGFIGTVLGLSQAIGSFGQVLSDGSGLEALKTALSRITGGLSVAFDTTFIGLVAALAIEMLHRGLKKREENFLDDCKEYCHANIVSKLRLIRTSDEQVPAAREDLSGVPPLAKA